ncbi:MAG: NAD(P)/FAD-dependent oxidoreductase [Acidimicrobiales bacterium]|nr:NAD(P)/FAD-dependent oxidoreductase [Acidimicrobiales bacterium]
MTDDAVNALRAAQERYATERAKRIRPDGLDQYVLLDGQHEQFDRDPYADPDFARESIVEDTDAVILGGGFSGMLTAVELGRRGVESYRMIEKGGDFGGTWYWNRYPGCRCDVESYIYMPFLEETGYMPTEKYATAPEIFEHCQRIGTHFGLYEHALFQTEIETAAWSDDEHRWLITTTRGDQLRARFFVAAGGLLHKAKLPGIPGVGSYTGRTFHTARWDYAFTGGSPTEPMTELADKRVGIVGTGATAVQLVPQLARDAAEVFVFQRTPATVAVRRNGPTDEQWFRSLQSGWQTERMRNFTAAVSGEQPSPCLVDDGWIDLMWDNLQQRVDSPEEQKELDLLDFEVMQRLRDRVDAMVDDPATAEKLKPWYGKHCKRVCFHDEYLPAFNEPNVHLVDTDGAGVAEVGTGGPIVDGSVYDVDLLIFASGFEVTTPVVRRLGFDPVGRGGVTLSERWADGAHTLHGNQTAGFPNLLFVAIAQASSSSNFVHFITEATAHVAWIVASSLEDDVVAIEPEPEAEDEWLQFLWRKAAEGGDYMATCTPSYFNGEQGMSEQLARSVVYPGNVSGYADHLARWRAEGGTTGVRRLHASQEE